MKVAQLTLSASPGSEIYRGGNQQGPGSSAQHFSGIPYLQHLPQWWQDHGELPKFAIWRWSHRTQFRLPEADSVNGCHWRGHLSSVFPDWSTSWALQVPTGDMEVTISLGTCYGRDSWNARKFCTSAFDFQENGKGEYSAMRLTMLLSSLEPCNT